MTRKSVNSQNSLVQATIIKKCDRGYHKPGSNKGCAAGTCQHTCEPAQVPDCPHKWTVRYSVSSRQREQSFGSLTDAQTFQLTLSTGKQTQGAMFTDPLAGIVEFLPLCDAIHRRHGEGQPQDQGHLPQQLRQPRSDEAASRERASLKSRGWTPR